MKKKTFKRVCSAVITAILVLCVSLCLVVVTKSALGAEPSVLGFRCFYVVTGSMGDTIPVNSTIVVHKKNAYKQGDVITFRSEDEAIRGMPNTHRINEVIEENGSVLFRTKGDANPVCDADLVSPEQVYGKVVFCSGDLHLIGRFFGFLMTPSGFFVAILVPLLLVAVFAMKDYVKTYKEALARLKAEQNAPPPADPIPPASDKEEKP